MNVRTRLKKMISGALVAYYRRRGCKIGRNSQISTTTKMDLTNPRGIVIGDYTVISFRTAILAHDFINRRHVTTTIGSNCFIGAGVMIMPGVTVNDNAIVGAGSVVFTDVPSNTIVSGNPARIVEKGVDVGRFGIPVRQVAAPTNDAQTSRAALPQITESVFTSDALLKSYFGNLPLEIAFSDSGFDSFALITLRAEIEEVEGLQIADDDWAGIATPR